MAKHVVACEFTPIFREAAADLIINAELKVLSRVSLCAQVWIHKHTGELLVTDYKPGIAGFGDRYNTEEKGYVLLWDVQEPRSVIEIQTMAQRNFNSPFNGDRWIDWYLTECFRGKISWTAKESMDDIASC